MSCILHIESAAEGCSVAVSEEGELLFFKEDHAERNNAVTLGVFVDEAMSLIDSRGLEMTAVSVSEGPGSYTGLRIGVSMAKGICYARGAKLIAVPTLKLLCVPLLLGDELPEDALLCPMIDARRMEVYSAVYDRALSEVRGTRADIVDAATYCGYLDAHPVYFLGNGSQKCSTIINHPNAHFVPDCRPLAKWSFPIAEKALLEGKTEDVAYFEPFYLKDFIALKPKKLI
ncbi:MAG: tRNA (adenosine(37)-N6)-threonylcarbamoyltransferase complex dimerization subunit type 1 TsaB [Bacteroidaceae bacterium]|nr:tRNA (adenosine(37)-N6)-threonylcarbamoyltransferase complex dimerization subunit type 1 TsaB [Bacteroidaceae bacterium]